MANTKEIQGRMKSIQDTMKITNAMYMIASSKLKKSKKKLEETEPYFYTLQSTMSRIIKNIPDMQNIYFDQHDKKKPEEKNTGYIVVTADKGMAGAYNHNLLKLAEEHMKGCSNPILFVLGELGRQYFERKKCSIEEQFDYTVQNPTLSRARKIARYILEWYNEEKLDEVYIIYTRMVSSMQAEPEVLQLLPLKKADFKQSAELEDTSLDEIAFFPSPEAVMNRIVPDYMVGFVYGALVESYSSEQNSRMMAMEAATDSAKDMLKELDIIYNRARQAAITQEITEVIAGAKAQKKKKEQGGK